MNTSAQTKETPATKPAIVNAVDQAPVVQSGIANKALKPTEIQMKAFLKAIREGKPKGHIFPAKLSEMDFSPEFRKEIQVARKEHKLACRNGKKALIKSLQSAKVDLVGHNQNAKETRGDVKYVKREAFLDKVGKFSQEKYNKFFGISSPTKATA